VISSDYITLRLIRLRPLEQWHCSGTGLSFLFPKAGITEFKSLGCVEEGSGITRQLLSPGQLLVLNSTAGGTLSPSNGSGVAFWHFSASAEHMVPLFAGREICLLPKVIEKFRVAKAYPASSGLARECNKLLEGIPAQNNLGHRGQLLRIIAAILSDAFEEVQAKGSGSARVEDRLMRVFQELSAAEVLSLSVEDLAQKLGCSRRHLSRLFHQHFGSSVVALRMEMRLLKAVSLLRDPEAKIINVAQDSGFNHLGLFHSIFKRRFGCSPGEWRKLNAQNALPIPGARSKSTLRGANGRADGVEENSLSLAKAAALRLNASQYAPFRGGIEAKGQNLEQEQELRARCQNAL
jgi:AraC-like DNA-binding protein